MYTHPLSGPCGGEGSRLEEEGSLGFDKQSFHSHNFAKMCSIEYDGGLKSNTENK